MSTDRHFVNEYEDYPKSNSKANFVYDQCLPEINRGVYELLKIFELDFVSKSDKRDSSVYTGYTGVAIMYMKLAETQAPEKAEQSITKARNIMMGQRLSKRRHDFTFLCGDVGLIAVRAVLNYRVGCYDEFKCDINTLQKFASGCISLETGEPDELLYGRAGYLYALLYMEANVASNSIDDKLIHDVVDSIMKSGRLLASQTKFEAPLMYKWHGTFYLGAAHGLAGILTILLEAGKYLSNSDLDEVKRTIDFLITQKSLSGNYPSSLGSSDRLVQWCHGAPGLLLLFAKAYDFFKEDSYLMEARSCADVVWKYGLLKKGYGLCHGVAGNAYCFLRLYRITREPCYLYRAWRFAQFCCAYSKNKCRKPDRPYSLFEGLAGTISFLADMLQPLNSKFPAFEI